jgi:hypothetical protein
VICALAPLVGAIVRAQQAETFCVLGITMSSTWNRIVIAAGTDPGVAVPPGPAAPERDVRRPVLPATARLRRLVLVGAQTAEAIVPAIEPNDRCRAVGVSLECT